MRKHRRFDEETTTTKSFIIFGLIFMVFFSTSIALTSFPQHLALSDKTVIQAIKFIDNNTILIKGNQVQVGAGDVIPLQGRDYIRITGNQVQVGQTSYNEGIRILTASWYQNVLFSQKIGTWNTNQVAQIVVDRVAFNLIPLSSDTISVTTIDTTKNSEQRYNVQFTQDTTFLNDHGVMLKLVKNHETVTAFLIGMKKSDSITLKVI